METERTLEVVIPPKRVEAHKQGRLASMDTADESQCWPINPVDRND